MTVDRSALQTLPAAAFKELLPLFLAGRVDSTDPAHIQTHVDHWTPSQCEQLLSALQTLGDEHRVYSANPLCQSLARGWMPNVLSTTVTGVEHVHAARAAGRTLIVTNHASYLDAVATDVALVLAEQAEVADKIVYLAGPKVYQELFRLVAAASIHSLPVPQSKQVSQGQDIPVRELARRAMTSLEAGQRALERGQILLFYPEGSRTRTGRLGSFLKATRRYIQAADFVVPASIVGTDEVMPLSTGQLSPGAVRLCFGPPIEVRAADNAREVLISAHSAISDLLPDARKPLPDTPPLV